MANIDKNEHEIHILERREARILGVCEVVSFDDTSVVMHTPLGTLIVQGHELQLKTLTLEGGNVSVEGHIAALSYEEPRPAGGWLSRLVR